MFDYLIENTLVAVAVPRGVTECSNDLGVESSRNRAVTDGVRQLGRAAPRVFDRLLDQLELRVFSGSNAGYELNEIVILVHRVIPVAFLISRSRRIALLAAAIAHSRFLLRGRSHIFSAHPDIRSLSERRLRA